MGDASTIRMDSGQMFDHLKQEPRALEVVIVDIDAFFAENLKKLCGREGICVNCCSGCATSNGHFDFSGMDMTLQPVVRWSMIMTMTEAAEKIKQLRKQYGWSRTKGFLKKDGCGLPRAARSIYCQMTHCRALDKFYTNNDWRRLSSLINELRTLRTEEKALI